MILLRCVSVDIIPTMSQKNNHKQNEPDALASGAWGDLTESPLEQLRKEIQKVQ